MDVRPRAAVAFFPPSREPNLISNLTQKMAKPIELHCEDGSEKCFPFIGLYFAPLNILYSLFLVFSLSDVRLPFRMKLHV